MNRLSLAAPLGLMAALVLLGTPAPARGDDPRPTVRPRHKPSKVYRKARSSWDKARRSACCEAEVRAFCRSRPDLGAGADERRLRDRCCAASVQKRCPPAPEARSEFWDYVALGGAYAATEGGASLSARGEVKIFPVKSSKTRKAHKRFVWHVPVNAGALWFADRAHPFVSATSDMRVRFALGGVKLSFRPRITLAYTDVNSDLYADFAFGLTAEYEWTFDDDFVRCDRVATWMWGPRNEDPARARRCTRWLTDGGAGRRIRLKLYPYWDAFGGSYPKADSLYSNLYVGASVDLFGRVQAYTIPRFFGSADTAMATAYLLNYRYHFQGIESGLNLRLGDERDWLVGGFADYDRILSRYGGRLGRTFQALGIRFQVSAGAGRAVWTDRLSGKNDWIAFAEVQAQVSDTSDTSFSGTFEHVRLGYTPQTAVAYDDCNKDKNPQCLHVKPVPQHVVKAVEDNLAAAQDYASFVARYKGASEADLIETARRLGRLTKVFGYDRDALTSLKSHDIFGDAVKRVAEQTHEEIYRWVRDCKLNGTCGSGVALCAGIHSLVADFLRKNGIRAVAASVNSERMMHVVAVAMTEQRTYLINYGDLYDTRAGGFDEVLRYYAQHVGRPVFFSHIYDPGASGDESDLVGVYQPPESVLFYRTLGTHPPDIVKGFLMGTSF